jgi:hypothetical protein
MGWLQTPLDMTNRLSGSCIRTRRTSKADLKIEVQVREAVLGRAARHGSSLR